MGRPSNESGVSPRDQATLRAPAEYVQQLKLIAAKERCTLFDLVTVVLGDYIQSYLEIDPSLGTLAGPVDEKIKRLRETQARTSDQIPTDPTKSTPPRRRRKTD